MMSEFGEKVCITFQPLLACPFWIKHIVGGLRIVANVLVICDIWSFFAGGDQGW